jgi:fructuronate reductase
VMKLRMLNGSHSLIAYLGAVAGLEAVRDVMAEAPLRKLVQAHMRAAAATLPPIPGFDPAAYAADLIHRFQNPAIRHLCLQIAADGSQKLPPRIFAPAADALAQGQDAAAFALATAAWARLLQGRADTGATLSPNDPLVAILTSAATDASPVAALSRALGLQDRLPFTSAPWCALVETRLAALRTRGVIELAKDLA